jgi:S1-C subfamily serine protease
LLLLVSLAAGQQPAIPSAPTAPPLGQSTVVAQSTNAGSGQVLSVVHRINSMELLRLLGRSGVGSVESFPYARDEEEVHTRIAAGYSLGADGAVVTRLPRAEVETLAQTYSWKVAPTPEAPTAPTSSGSNSGPTSPPARTEKMTATVASDLFVLRANGQTFQAKFLGWDEATGLALLQADGLPDAPRTEADPAQLALDETLRIVAPELSPKTGPQSNRLLLALGEVPGKISNIIRDGAGQLKSLTLSLTNMTRERARGVVGGVVLNAQGETIGMVESSDGTSARIYPVAVLRRAAERVKTRRAKSGQPWLGILGESVATSTLVQLQATGWKRTQAQQLLDKRQGVLLTTVPSGTPAAKANLRPGDVVVRVDAEEIEDADDLSGVIGRGTAEAPMTFNVLRPSGMEQVAVQVKLEWVTNAREKTLEALARDRRKDGVSLALFGIDKLDLTGQLAANFGTQKGGWLVLNVHENSIAKKSGVLAGDVIETVNGTQSGVVNAELLPAECRLGILRRTERLEITLSYKPGQD